MKKVLLLFLLFSVAGILFLSFPIQQSTHFVKLTKRGFTLNDKPFYPIVLNYVVSLQADNKEMWACPYGGYNPGFNYLTFKKDSSQMQLQADLDLIKELGFNTVRFTGVGEPYINLEKKGELSVVGNMSATHDTTLLLTRDKSYEYYFDAIQLLLNAANNARLKVIFLSRISPEFPNSEEFLRRLAKRFCSDTTLLAYDMFNEPLYFDKPERDKKEVHEISKRWNRIFKMYAPHQLTTIGLEGIREVHEWDPNILDFDFLSFHPYEYETEQVRNEIYWFGKYVKKPWILGETAIPADNDSIKYETQKLFADKTLEQTCNCGGFGYSWWQYKDVDWHAYHANFMGVLNWKGTTIGKKNKLPVYGTVKPLANSFINYHPQANKDSCLQLSNYYNYSKNSKFSLVGKLVDEDDKPVEGGIILGWNNFWSHSYHTISKEDGSFQLTSNYPFYHWIASACDYSMTRGDVNPDTAKKVQNSVPTINIGKLVVEKLNF